MKIVRRTELTILINVCDMLSFDNDSIRIRCSILLIVLKLEIKNNIIYVI